MSNNHKIRLTLFAFGSRGDVQPYVALGRRLQQAGYEVTLLAGDEFETFVTGYGLRFFPLGFRIRETISESDAARAVLEGKRNLIVGMRELIHTLKPAVEQMLHSTWQACQQADAIIFSTLGLSAYHAAEKLKIPCLWALTMPAFNRTQSFPSPLFPLLPIENRAFNWATHLAAEIAWQQLTGRTFNTWRRSLDLPAMQLNRWTYTHLNNAPLPKLYHFSPTVIPKPPDWDDHAHITGYWFLDDEPGWQPPPELLTFLESGTPPICIGFGSMAERRIEETNEILLQALKLSGQRGLLLTGWAGLGQTDLPKTVFKLESAPHSWLFPRMAAVAHHGGAGTVAAGLRAGVPSIIVPFAGDQPFWAQQIEKLKVGPKPIARSQLTAEKLAEAFRFATCDAETRQRAASLGERIRAEDGCGQAVEIIGHHLRSR